jgi:hypothetical protein
MSADDERARERAAILQRRAKLVAYAVAAGVATTACSGKTASVCLLFQGGSGGQPTFGGGGVCLSIAPGGTGGAGPIAPCLSPIVGGNSVCLQPPYPCLSGAPNMGPGGAGGEPAAEGGATSEGGETGEGGAGPSICLTPVR